MIVTDLKYALENRLVAKLDIMIDRCCRDKVEKDALLINEGAEGEGKTNSSISEAYYVKWKAKETYNQDRDIHLFFRLASMLQFAKTTEKKIIVWDEPSLDSLKKDALSQVNKQLERLFMTCRKKRHFFIINFTKFFKFSEYVVVDRGLGLIHMYSKNETVPGKFAYIKKKNLETLYQTYLSKKKRIYRELTSFRGNFKEILSEYFDKMGIIVEGMVNCTYAQYNKLKDKSIESIGEDTKGMSKRELATLKKLNELRYKIATFPLLTKDQIAKHFGLHSKTIQEWRKIDLKEPIPLEKFDFEGEEETNIINSRVNDQEKSDNDEGLDDFPEKDDLEELKMPENQFNKDKKQLKATIIPQKELLDSDTDLTAGQ